MFGWKARTYSTWLSTPRANCTQYKNTCRTMRKCLCRLVFPYRADTPAHAHIASARCIVSVYRVYTIASHSCKKIRILQNSIKQKKNCGISRVLTNTCRHVFHNGNSKRGSGAAVTMQARL